MTIQRIPYKAGCVSIVRHVVGFVYASKKFEKPPSKLELFPSALIYDDRDIGRGGRNSGRNGYLEHSVRALREYGEDFSECACSTPCDRDHPLDIGPIGSEITPRFEYHSPQLDNPTPCMCFAYSLLKSMNLRAYKIQWENSRFYIPALTIGFNVGANPLDGLVEFSQTMTAYVAAVGAL